MTFGLKVWDASGNLVLDTVDRLSKLQGVVNITVSSPNPFSETFQSVSGMADDGTWAAVGDNFNIFARVASGGFYWTAAYNAGTYPVTILRV